MVVAGLSGSKVKTVTYRARIGSSFQKETVATLKVEKLKAYESDK